MFFGSLGDNTMHGVFDIGGGSDPFYTDYPNIGVFDGGTVYGGTEYPNTGSGINWQSIINQGFGAASQIFGAWGPRATQQTGAGGAPIGSGYSPAAVLQSAAQLQAAQQQQAQQRALTGGGSNSLDGIFASLTSTISSNPLIFAAAGVGLYLLMREPPRRR